MMNKTRVRNYNQKIGPFKVGRMVYFDWRGKTWFGIVRRCNIKRLTVITNDGTKWYVNPAEAKQI